MRATLRRYPESCVKVWESYPEPVDSVDSILPGCLPGATGGKNQTGAVLGATELSWHQQDTVAQGLERSVLERWREAEPLGATLHPAGLRTVETARQAAEALRPLAGDGAYLLYALGVIGTGLLAIPVLAGSASYAVAELFHWRSSLDLPVRGATHFYLLLTGGMLVGLGLDVGGFNAVQMLYWTAVVNVCSGAAASGPRHDRGRERTSHGSSRKRSVAAGPGLGLRGRDDGGGRGYVCQLRRNRGLAQFSREELPPTVPQPGNDR